MKTKPEAQIYTNYTVEDFEVWKILFDRQLKNLERHVSLDFLDALEKVRFTSNRIPDFKEVNSLLQNQTGWSLYTVPNISEQATFFNLLSKQQFTATCWLRSKEELDYLEEPDMFHDVFAHTPLLSNKTYCGFFKHIGSLAMKHSNNPAIIKMLGSLYWFTIEFGMIYENRNMKAYGAGIISSAGETKNALSNYSKKIDFDVHKILHTDFRTDVLQETYFVIDSFEQLQDALSAIEKIVDECSVVNLK